MRQSNNLSRCSSYRDSIKALEADLQHANTMAASLPSSYDGESIKLSLSYSPFAPMFIYLIEWLDYSCIDSIPSYLGLLHVLIKVYVHGVPSISSKDRRATIREFYGLLCPLCYLLQQDSVIYPSLRLLQGELMERKGGDNRVQDAERTPRKDLEKDDECTICMDSSAKMALPSCGHSLCLFCFHDWHTRSETCPFCRGSLRNVEAGDLWVLTSICDVVDLATLASENLRRFYRYIENLPFANPEPHLFVYDYLI